ncbi:hypothetical protein HRG_009677 [Hirsutella rhossiliensis]|uniref:Uncharacterized protein n=1 Tax=Hirsutella rhossiliensis TaxID=111463 RepID=A0A9P8MS50_9HYPO|nr:uncharacterized protein HRG_09677 [Hirsutella rhossiliensis]KAH0959216.1 hypothetical protein HRG_09677 [Hirsutella rhossiliensis]
MSSFVDTLGVPASAIEFHYNTVDERTRRAPKHSKTLLKGFEPIQVIGAVGVSWRLHTSNGQEVRQPSVRKAFTECISDDEEHNGEGTDNRHIKSIVRLRDYHAASTPHYFLLNNDAITVGEHGDLVKDSFRLPPTRDRLAIYHYAVKSREEMEAKMSRGNGMDQPKA